MLPFHTGSGVVDCAGCGMPTMTGDMTKPAYCDDECRERDEDAPEMDVR